MKKNMSLVDIFKLLFAIGIVAIHSKLFIGNSIYEWVFLHAALRLAVPFFFCTSGYFFYLSLKKGNSIKQVTYKYLKRIMIPFVFWLLLNLPIVIYNYHQEGLKISNMIAKIFRSLIFYPWGALWYLLALMVAIVFIIPFYKRNKLTLIVWIGAILYLFCLICNTYYFVVDGTAIQKIIDGMLTIISSARNGIFEGIYFVSSGMLVAKYSEEKKINFKLNNYLFFVLYALLVVEIILTKNCIHKDDHSLFIMLIPVIPSLLILLGQFSFKTNTISFRNYSAGIYFSHRFVLGIVTIIMSTSSSIVTFMVTMIVILLCLYILYSIDNNKINYLIK